MFSKTLLSILIFFLLIKPVLANQDVGVKKIYVPEKNGIITLKYILNNWSSIEKNMKSYDSSNCVKKESSIESILSVSEFFGDERKSIVRRSRPLLDSDRVFIIETKNLCEKKTPYTHGPSWVVVETKEKFEIDDKYYIEE